MYRLPVLYRDVIRLIDNPDIYRLIYLALALLYKDDIQREISNYGCGYRVIIGYKIQADSSITVSYEKIFRDKKWMRMEFGYSYAYLPSGSLYGWPITSFVSVAAELPNHYHHKELNIIFNIGSFNDDIYEVIQIC